MFSAQHFNSRAETTPGNEQIAPSYTAIYKPSLGESFQRWIMRMPKTALIFQP